MTLCVSLFTSMDVDFSDALFAQNLATPNKDAVATLSPRHGHRIVSATAAQKFAAVDTVRRQVALASSRTERTHFGVAVAVVRRTFVIDEVVVRRLLVFGEPRFEDFDEGATFFPLTHRHLRGAVVFDLQVVAKSAERRHLPPARLEFATP